MPAAFDTMFMAIKLQNPAQCYSNGSRCWMWWTYRTQGEMQKHSITVLQVKWKNQICIFPNNWKMNCLWKWEDRFHRHLLLIGEGCNIDKAGDHFDPSSINQCWDSWPGRGWNMPSASLTMKLKSLENAEKWLKLFWTFSVGCAAIPQSPAMKTISGFRFGFLYWMFTSTMSSIHSFSQAKAEGSITKREEEKEQRTADEKVLWIWLCDYIRTQSHRGSRWDYRMVQMRTDEFSEDLWDCTFRQNVQLGLSYQQHRSKTAFALRK